MSQMFWITVTLEVYDGTEGGDKPPKEGKAQWLNDICFFISSSVSSSGNGRMIAKKKKKTMY